MAALIGYLQGNRGEVSRLGSKSSGINSRLQTWHGGIRTQLNADGEFVVYVYPDNGPSKTITGNVDTGRIDN